MASKAIDEINSKITFLQDQRRQADDALAVAIKNHAEKVGDIDAKLADWAEVLDRYHGTADVKAPRAKSTPAVKKTAAK